MDELDLRVADPAGVPAEAVVLDQVVRIDPFAGVLTLDGETVVLDPATGACHLLDRPGTVVLGCLDGESSLREIAADIAEAVGLDAQRIERDVLDLARGLGARGLLEGVLREAPAAPPALAEMGGLPVGSDLGSWPGWDRQPAAPLLVVGWGTRCGFCTQLADQLADGTTGPTVLLVTTGSPEELAAQLGDVHLPAVHVVAEPEFLAGLGTPVAYLVDEARRTASPLAVGADGVLALLRGSAA